MHSIIFVAVLSSTIISLSLLGLIVVARERQRRALLTGVQLLQASRVLLVHLQQHRGLSAARLVGVSEGLGDVLRLRRQILLDMATLSDLDDGFATDENWLGVTRHWASLSAESEKITLESNFDQHCRLISALLQLMVDMASHYGMDMNPRYAETRVVWHELLLIGELIGQCRALGMAVLTRGVVSGGQRFQQRHIEKNLEKIEFLVAQTPCRKKLTPQQIEGLECFSNLVRKQILEDLKRVSAMEYFDRASKTIESIYESFDREMLKLHRKAV